MQVSGLLLQQRPWPQLRETAQRWDASDARALYVADHLRGTPAAPEETWFDAIALLGALAASTSRIRLGTMVASVTLRDPVMLALAARSLDGCSAGRFELGLGAGGRPSDATMRGQAPRHPAQMASAFADAVTILDGLLRGDRVDHAGEVFTAVKARLSGACVQQPRVPLHLAAHGARTLEVVARFGDAWNVAGDRHGDRASQMATLQRLSRMLDERLDAHGRAHDSIRRSVLVGIYPGMTFETLDELRALAAELGGIGFDELIVYDPPFALDDGPVAASAVIDELLTDLVLDAYRGLAGVCRAAATPAGPPDHSTLRTTIRMISPKPSVTIAR